MFEKRGRIDTGLAAEIPIGEIPGLFFLLLIESVQEFTVVDEFKYRLHSHNIPPLEKKAAIKWQFIIISYSFCVQYHKHLIDFN